MKKSLLVSSAAALLLSLSAVAPMAVSAADDNGNATGDTTAEFTVTPNGEGTTTPPGGDEGTGKDTENLWLVNAPNMVFKKVALSDLVKAGATTSYDAKTTADPTATNKPADPKGVQSNTGVLKVTDLRGTGAGWVLSASATPATIKGSSDTSADLSGTLNLVFNAATTDNTDTQLATTAAIDTNETATPVWTAAKGTGQGDNATTLTDATNFVIGKNANAQNATYDSTITWTLSSTPTTGN